MTLQINALEVAVAALVIAGVAAFCLAAAWAIVRVLNSRKAQSK